MKKNRKALRLTKETVQALDAGRVRGGFTEGSNPGCLSNFDTLCPAKTDTTTGSMGCPTSYSWPYGVCHTDTCQ